MSDAEPISLTQACNRMNLTGKGRERRLLRYIQARERSLEVKILETIGGAKHGKRYRVTMRAMKRYCRNMFLPEPSELLPAFRKLKSELYRHVNERVDDRIVELTGPTIEDHNQKIDFLRTQVAKTQKDLDKLLARTRSLAN